MPLSTKHAVWIIVLALVVLLVGLLAAPRVLGEEPWVTVLRAQLDAEQKCQNATIVEVREVTVAGQVRLDGKVRCLDGRQYDFTREQMHRKFDVRACAPAVC